MKKKNLYKEMTKLTIKFHEIKTFHTVIYFYEKCFRCLFYIYIFGKSMKWAKLRTELYFCAIPCKIFK